jgi:hypothetical protein
MRFIFGFLIGLILGGLLAVILESQRAAAQPDDGAIFGLDDRGASVPVSAS